LGGQLASQQQSQVANQAVETVGSLAGQPPQQQPSVSLPMQQYTDAMEQPSNQPVNAGQGQNVQLPTGDQQGWQYKQAQSAATQAQNANTQGKGGNKVTYPATSGAQQFGQPMQSAYPNTIGQGQQSSQMKSSGKGKGA
jgi:hypothetical protein